MAKLNKRDELSKANGMEAWYRGGFSMGWEAALSSVRAALELAERHVSELEAWAVADPGLETDPPALILSLAEPAELGDISNAKRM